MIRYYAGTDVTAPQAVECPVPGYPNRDILGRTQYVNSHFDSEEEAWRRLLAESRAGVSLSVVRVRELRDRLAKAEACVVEQALERDAVEDQYRVWQRGRPS